VDTIYFSVDWMAIIVDGRLFPMDWTIFPVDGGAVSVDRQHFSWIEGQFP